MFDLTASKRRALVFTLFFFGVSPFARADELPRYLVLGAYIGEIVVELGAADQIVGISAGSDYIKELADVPRIPGFRSTSAEAILALAPTDVLTAESQTRPEIVTQLGAAGVNVHVLPEDVSSLDLVPQQIERIGEILGRQTEAEALTVRFNAELKDALDLVKRTTSRPKIIFILSGGGRPTIVAGADTHVALLIEAAGADNVTDDISGFKPMSQESMIEAAPDYILVNEEGLELSGGVPVALAAPGALLTPAGRNGNIFALPTGYLQGLGLNSPKAIRAIAKHIHPEIAGPPR